jgi:hypothetical protein
MPDMDRDATTGTSTTTEPEHWHFCVDCDDHWSHQNSECAPSHPRLNRRATATVADCPLHEEESR